MANETSLPRASLVVLWGPAGAATAFDDDYRRRHVPLVRAIPGLVDLRAFRLRASTHHRLAELVFESPEGLRAAMESPEAAAALRDAQRLEAEYGVASESHVALLDEE